ncbi:uncharacterized mitochondrial protein AtMg00810-like [Actinidia eriantha]|uniref:uncharacterized mitochondrial protein AtMg00810-like n=1 Tax=Actinidia eriantha TaxID=165200 RepID=UPI0025892D31|nr:uncharacterized mitochondrial protein AtMg00810-like [Actinidia eriantha]
MTFSSLTTEPTTFAQAMKQSEWRQAMLEEYGALIAQGTWTLVSPPTGVSPIGCKWVFRIKRNFDGSIARYKARLVAQGFQQQEGLDYTETFSPVVKQRTIRVMLSLALHHGWPVKQLDVSNAFLHGFLQEDVYMKQHHGYIDALYPQHVCKLKKALYDLKQAPRAWYDMFSKSLLAQDFINSMSDSSLFIFNKGSDIIYILVYVDDILITGSSSSLIESIISNMSSSFALKNLGSLHYFLGIEVLNVPQGLFLSQVKYATDLLTKVGMKDCKPSGSPSSLKSSVVVDDPLFDKLELYKSLVGSLQYLILTRPELSFSMNMVCQFMYCPRLSHFIAVKQILRYIKGTLHQGLLFTKGSLNLSAYSDADWAGNSLDKRSTSGYCVFLGDNLIFWSAKKQPTVARSSTEAEYKALANAASKLIWLQ